MTVACLKRNIDVQNDYVKPTNALAYDNPSGSVSRESWKMEHLSIWCDTPVGLQSSQEQGCRGEPVMTLGRFDCDFPFLPDVGVMIELAGGKNDVIG